MLFDHTSSLWALIANGNTHRASCCMMRCIIRAHCGMSLVSTWVHPATGQRCPALGKSELEFAGEVFLKLLMEKI